MLLMDRDKQIFPHKIVIISSTELKLEFLPLLGAL